MSSRWQMLFAAGLCTAGVLGAGCSADEPPAPVEALPWDDDRPRLDHCPFEAAPSREARAAVEPAPLRAGIGSAVIDLPIGTPFGGYRARVEALGGAVEPDGRAARWATAMTPSVGVHDAPMAQALALESGGERLVILRVDAPVVTENVLFELERKLAPDGSMRGRILLTASHSHAAWSAWLPSVHLAPGVDTPRRELFERAVEALRQAAESALAGLAPARMGIAVDHAFDPDDRITANRRPENDEVVGPDGNRAGAGKDPVAWALRVDDAAGSPVVALVNLAVHGTVGTGANPLASSDAPGAIARALSAELGYPVFHLQGAAGDIEPAGPAGRTACVDSLRCLDMPGLEILGARASELVAPLVQSIVSEPETAFEVVTRTFAVGRGDVVRRPDGTELYYLPPDPEAYPDRILFGADGRAASPFDEFNARSGAGLCGQDDGVTFAPLPGTAGLMPYAPCIDLDRGAGFILGIFEMQDFALPLCDSVRATGAAIRISGLDGGDWMLVGVPGEPTAPFAAYLRGRSPVGAERTLLIGYSDDYSGYMLTSEDWLSSGYECSTNIWGPREGEQVLEELVVTMELAATPELEDPEVGTSRLPDFDFPTLDAVEAIVTSDHGAALASGDGLWWPDRLAAAVSAADEVVSRGVGVARFAWLGGNPAVDFPEVVVEREAAAGQFEALVDARGEPASSHRGVVVVTYTPDPIDSATPSSHRYAASWQPAGVEPFALAEPLQPLSLPVGSYRLRVQGKALAAGGVESYQVLSPAFTVAAAPLSSQSSAVRGATALELQASLPSAAGLRALREGPSDVELPLLGPWQVTVTFDDATTQGFEVTPDDAGAASLALPPVDLARVVSVELRDAAGNGGLIAVP